MDADRRLPVVSGNEEECEMNTGTESMRFLCVFAFELGRLKRLPRTGWGDAGVPGPVESVAEHSHRTSLLAFMIAAEEGADPDRAAALGAWHDVPEVWTGDTSHARIPYVRTVDPALVIADQTETLPASLAERARAAVVEFERGGESAEAVVARDADRLECLLQAREYQRMGASDVGDWIESSLASLRTASALAVARAALETEPGAWRSRIRRG